ncbi:MAG: hypothetical protein U0610_15210 [bacterium]
MTTIAPAHLEVRRARRRSRILLAMLASLVPAVGADALVVEALSVERPPTLPRRPPPLVWHHGEHGSARALVAHRRFPLALFQDEFAFEADRRGDRDVTIVAHEHALEWRGRTSGPTITVRDADDVLVGTRDLGRVGEVWFRPAADSLVRNRRPFRWGERVQSLGMSGHGSCPRGWQAIARRVRGRGHLTRTFDAWTS